VLKKRFFTCLLLLLVFYLWFYSFFSNPTLFKVSIGNLSCNILLLLTVLINIGLKNFIFEPRCFDISFGKLEKKTHTLQTDGTKASYITEAIKLALSRLACCELSRLRCHGQSLRLSSYLCRIKQKENSSCSVCGHQLQDLTSPPSGLSRIWVSPARHLWHYLFYFYHWSRPKGMPRLLGLRGIPPFPILGRGRVAPPPRQSN